MDIVTIDFETYYDKDYSLSKMTTEAYVRDPRFEVIGVGVKVNNHPTDWYSGNNPGRFLKSLSYKDKAILCHNTVFDGAILSWHFGIQPKLWLDTLSMARPLHNVSVGGSLKSLVTYYGLGAKGDEVINALGKRRADFSSEDMQRYASYCVNDVDLTYQLFQKMKGRFTAEELRVIDIVLRMYTDPTIELDQPMLQQHLDEVLDRKSNLVAEMGLNCTEEEAKATLMSNEKFASFLKAYGVEPPMKMSARTSKMTYAFGKTDKAFTALLEHEDPRVQNAVAARLGVKSTIEQSRTQSLLGVAERGKLPIMLNYYGAHTGRFSGGDKMNLQNLPRGGTLRKSLCAPKGKVLIACDSSQIEARMVAWVADQTDLLQAFREGRDVYSEFASEVYGKKVTKADKVERFVGKTCLGSGTLVLTRRGWVPIVDVLCTDQLWDGVEWVTHHGVCYMGVKPTILMSGVELTPDHEILTGPTRWEVAQDVLKSSTAFLSALSLATFPSSGIRSTPPNQVSRGGGTHSVNAHAAAVYYHMPHQILEPEGQPRATIAPSVRRPINVGGNIKQRYRMISTAAGYLIGCLRQLVGVTTPVIARINTMVREVFMSATYGGMITQSSLDMSSPSPVGMTLPSTWTGVTTTKGMNPEMSGSHHAQQTHPTSDKSQTLKPVFDILNSGSRNRFTILTNAGPIIVHNCILGLGYGMGAIKFRDTLALGQGGIKVEIEPSDAQRIVSLYRNKNHRIAAFWQRCGHVIQDLINQKEGQVLPMKALLPYKDNSIILPNRLPIQYPLLQRSETGDGFFYVSDGRSFRKAAAARLTGGDADGIPWVRIYGGKVTENIVQALARIVVTTQMVEIAKRYKIILQVHDEVVCCVDEAEAEEAKAFIMQCMSTPPAWAPDLPVACEADIGKNYGEAH